MEIYTSSFGIFRPSVHRVEDSGAALARLILAPELANTTGKYFAGNNMISSSTESYDRVKATELWETSAELVGLVQKKEVHKGLQKSPGQI